MTDVDSYQPPEVSGGTPSAPTAGSTEFSYGGGANANTLNIMMGVVFLGYSLLFTVMMMACVCNRQARGFTRFDLEATTDQQKTGPVGELDAMWRKAFIGKVRRSCQGGQAAQAAVARAEGGRRTSRRAA